MSPPLAGWAGGVDKRKVFVFGVFMDGASGKKIVLSIVVVTLVFSVLSWFPSPEPRDIGRLCIHCTLCWFLFKAKNWARWIMVVLLALGGSICAFALTSGQSGPEKSIALFVMSVTYLASAGLLAFSKSVEVYFSAPIQNDA